jgi:hypothetical protein
MDAYLKQHPDIFMPALKDLHFFGTDLVFEYRPTQSEAEYLGYFEDAREERRVGESSVWYLYSRTAAGELKDFRPDAGIIIMLRDPVDMMYSLHSQRLYIGAEDLDDFESALAAEPRRKRGLDLPRHFGMRDGVFYREIAGYADQVERYLKEFGRENVHVIVFDDFQRDTAGVYAETLRFLGVDARFRPAFPVLNGNRRVYSRTLTRWLRRPPRALLRLGATLTRRSLQRRVVEALARLNARPEPRPPMKPALRRRLQAEFAPEVERLSGLLGRNLTGWSRQ